MSEAMTTPTEVAPAPAPAADASVSPQPPASTMLGGEAAPAPVEAAPATTEAPASLVEAPVEAPIVYDLKLPETFQIDQAALTDMQAMAAEAKLPPEQAQKFVDLHVKATEAFVAQQQQAFAALQSEWVSELQKSPDFATPAARETSLRSIAGVLDEFGSPEVRSAFDMTGAGNNPHIVNFVLKVAKALSEGAPTTQGSPAFKTPTQSLSDRLYPSQGN